MTRTRLITVIALGDDTTMRRRRVRRLLIVGPLYAAVGVTLTVAISWTAAWHVPVTESRIRFVTHGGPAPVLTFGPPELPVGDGWAEPVERFSTAVSTFTIRNLAEPDPTEMYRRYCQYDYHYGFPLRSMSASRTEFSGSGLYFIAEPGSESGQMTGIVINRKNSDWLLLPTRVLWPGFIGNTLIWGGAVATLIAAWRIVRRRHRERQGRCPTCAYEINTLPRCPECGQLNPSARTA